tara:strand:+ start:3404 stop:5848 length:2445 start_codon:yes stop_codon:yes gene_type:complete
MANEILIKFKAEGNQAVVAAINQLHLAQTKLEKGQKAYEKALKKVKKEQDATGKGMLDLTNKGRLLQNSFATIRSKMLLVAFAATLVNQTLLRLVRLYADQELAQRRLTIALGHTSKTLVDQASSLQKVTRFGDEAIINAQAMVATFVKEEDQVAKVTEAVLDLASAKGMDLNTAADLVARSIGSSTNALSRYGIEASGSAGSTERLDSIINNVQKRFGGFAKGELNTVSGMLSATANAVGDAGEAFGEVLAPAVMTVAKAIKVMAEAINPERIRIFGAALLAAAYSTGHLTKAFKMLKGAMVLANLQIDKMRAKLLKSGLGIAVLVVGELAYQFGLFEESADEAGDAAKRAATLGREAIEEAAEEQKKYNEAIKDNIKSLDEQIVVTRARIKVEKTGSLQDKVSLALLKERFRVKRPLDELEIRNIQTITNLIHVREEEIATQRKALDMSKRLQDAEAALAAAKLGGVDASALENKLMMNRISLVEQLRDTFPLIEEVMDFSELLDELSDIDQKLIDSGETMGGLQYNFTGLEQQIFITMFKIAQANEDNLKGIQAQFDANKALADAKKQSTLDQLTLDKDMISNNAIGREGMLLDIENQQSKLAIQREFATENLKGLDLQLESMRITIEEIELTNKKAAAEKAFQKTRNDGYVNAAKNILILGRTLTKNKEQQKNINFALAMIDAYRAAVTTRKNLLDAGAVPPIPGIFAGIEFAAAAAQANNIRKMEEGGLIGGQRHSQGGTIIEAERGEFIMSRRAVESIGLGVLSTMNQGGGAINVNVTGNVLSSDFVEGELADKISEAVRKGVDFGMS